MQEDSRELTPSRARALRISLRERAADLAEEHEDLLVQLTTLRAASAESLHTLYFARPPRVACVRTTYRKLASLVDHGLLAKQTLVDSRSLYRLATAALSLSPRARARATDTMRKRLPQAEAGHAWLRATLWAELVARGYVVGRGRNELVTLRRFMIDGATKRAANDKAAANVVTALRSDPLLTPLFRARCSRCEWFGPLGKAASKCARCYAKTIQALSERRYECARCGAVSDAGGAHDSARHAGRCKAELREVDHLPFDVAWRSTGTERDVLLVFVDDPGRGLDEQLRALPLRITGQPKVPIVLRTTDATSVFDRKSGTWTARGERHRALLRAFSPEGSATAFPFSTTATVVEIKPELQLRLSPHTRRRESSHA